jgi:integrase
MSGRVTNEPLEAAIEEYVAIFTGDWSPKTLRKYEDAFRDFLAWLDAEQRPATTASLEFGTLLAYVAHQKAKPVVRGVWRGDREAVEAARLNNGERRSLNSINSTMRTLRAFVLWLHEDGRLPINPFARKHRRGGQNPLLPREATPTKAASLSDIEALERGCMGNRPLDLRDQAIVSVLKTTSARNSSVRLLRLSDIDLEREVITFRRAKSDQTYEVALMPETKAALIRYFRRGRPKLLPRYPARGYEHVQVSSDPECVFIARNNGRASGDPGPLSPNALSRMLTRRYHAGGGTLQHFGSHRIRHGTATILSNNGMPIEELSRHMGHSSTVVTKRYAVQTPQSIGRYTEAALRAGGLTRAPRRRAA